MTESHENMTLNAAILFPAVCDSDVISKAGMYGKSIKCIVDQPLEPAWLCPEMKCEAKKYFCLDVDRTTK